MVRSEPSQLSVKVVPGSVREAVDKKAPHAPVYAYCDRLSVPNRNQREESNTAKY